MCCPGPPDLLGLAMMQPLRQTAVFLGMQMAAPHVAGAAAIFLQGHPSASPAEVRGHDMIRIPLVCKLAVI